MPYAQGGVGEGHKNNEEGNGKLYAPNWTYRDKK